MGIVYTKNWFLFYSMQIMSPTVVWLFTLAIMSGTLMSVMLKVLSGYNMYLTYGLAVLVSSLVSLMIRWWWGKWSWWFEFHRGIIVLWLTFAGLNLWYTALYGQGINLAYVPIIVTGGMTVFLGLAGRIWFGEQMSLQFIVWSLIILAGMGVMVVKL